MRVKEGRFWVVGGLHFATHHFFLVSGRECSCLWSLAEWGLFVTLCSAVVMIPLHVSSLLFSSVVRRCLYLSQ